jgi:hypothetical protein
MASELERSGLVGEQRAGKLLYLVVTSRVLDRPICAVVKGPASAGKNFVTDRIVSLFPSSAVYRLTGMSERALAYGEEPLAHRVLFIEEAAGLTSGTGAYLMRSLISEGRLRYETVESGPDGLKPRVIEREGPTGLLVTTTALSLDAELETRLFSIPMTDSREQTREILMAMAAGAVGDPERRDIELEPWHGLQTWIELGEHHVVIPYAEKLAAAIPPLVVRLRRDFGAVLGLIKAHAVLHQAQRERDAKGRIVAVFDDYAAVYELVADLVSAGAGASVPRVVRETVEAVRTVTRQHPCGVSLSAIAEHLGLDKGTVSRRVSQAKELGFLIDEQEKRGQPAMLKIGEAMPEETVVLPRPEVLADDRCSVAAARRREAAREAPSFVGATSTENSSFMDAAE